MDNDLFYYVVVFIGLAMIWQHASLQFKQPIKVDAHRRYEILNDLEISSLASEGTIKIGKIIYVGTYVLIYLLALFFWDNISEFFKLETGQNNEGALGTPEFLQSILSNERFGRPLAVAATLMSLLAVGGQLAQYEEPVRRFAHRRAGIPRGIYRIARLLNTLSYSDIGKGQPAPALEKFNDKITHLQTAQCAVDAASVEKIGKQIQKLDILSPAVIGTQFDYAFDFPKIDELSERLNKLRADIQSIDDDIQLLDNTNCGIVELRHLSDKILKQDNNLVAMFAVLYLNTRGFNLHNIPTPTSTVLADLSVRKNTFELPAIIWAAAATLMISVIFYFVVHWVSLTISLADSWKLWSLSLSAEQLTVAANWSFRSLVEHLFLVVAVCVIAVVKRQEMIDDDSWPESFPKNQPPIARYLMSAIVPAVVACGLLAVIVQFETLYDQRNVGQDIVAIDKILNGLALNYIYYIGSFFGAMVLAIGIFFISDLHDDLPSARTTKVAVTSGLIFCVISLATFEMMHQFDQRLAFSDALKMSGFATMFLVLYARAIEHYETRVLDSATSTPMPVVSV